MKRGIALCALVTLAAASQAAATGVGDTVTLAVERRVVPSSASVLLTGSVSNGREGEPVTVEAKGCRERAFQAFAPVSTVEGGAWSTTLPVHTRTTFRARWRDARSPQVVLAVRPRIVLGQISQRLFRTQLLIGVHANGKRLLLQRFDANDRIWETVKAFVFKSPSPGWPQMTVSASVRKGTPVRLTLPRSQAQPCFLAGYSNILTT